MGTWSFGTSTPGAGPLPGIVATRITSSPCGASPKQKADAKGAHFVHHEAAGGSVAPLPGGERWWIQHSSRTRTTEHRPRHARYHASRSSRPVWRRERDDAGARSACARGSRLRSGRIGGAAHVASALQSVHRPLPSASRCPRQRRRAAGRASRGRRREASGSRPSYRRLRRLGRAGGKPRVGSRLRCLQRWPPAGPQGTSPSAGRSSD